MHFTRCAAVREYLVLAAIFSEPPPGAFRPLGITLIVLVCLAFAAGYWFWSHPIGAELEAPPVKASPHVVQWERKEVFYTHPAGEPFTFPLPALNGTSGDTPVEVTVDTSYLWPGWIEFNRDTLRISGVAPVIEQDKTYYLVFLAKADGGGESRLDVYLTITGQQASVQPQSSYHSVPSSAAPPRLESSVESQSPPLPPAISPTPNTAQESACLLKLLKGEPCSFGQDKDRGR
jgi:hypothetical protein